jgi:ABC-type sugar transport system substrate-binding protein
VSTSARFHWRSLPFAAVLALTTSGIVGGSLVSAQEQDPALADKVAGVDYLGLQHDFIVALKNAVDAEAGEQGLALVETDAKGDPATQIANAEQLITQGVDVMLFNGLDQQASVPALEAAEEAGIPVVLFNTFIDGPHATWVGSENVQSGEILGQFLLREQEAAGRPLRVLYIRGIPGHPAYLERDEGMKAALGDKIGDFELVERVANFDREEALRVTEEALTADPAYDIIAAQNDSMIMGALQAVKEQDLLDSIKTIGVDGIPEALEAVANGELTATVFQDAEGQGRGAVEAAIALLRGETVEPEIVIPFFLVEQADAPALLERVKELYGL